MDTDFVFIVSYSCPRCQALLESQANGPPTWLRCPACGRASLPPEHNRRSVTFLDEEPPLLIGNFTTGGPSASLPLRPRGMAPLPRPLSTQQGPATPTARILLGSGFFLTTILFVFSMLDANGERAGFFGLIAVICLILLGRQSNRRSRD